jgi:type VI secretion system protein ImpA
MTLDDLLQPVPGPSPTGDDLSFSPEFDAIAEARREDDPSLPLGEWKEKGKDLKSADWVDVQTRCMRLLRERSKDLRLAGWLTEAWAHEHGLAGLAQGLDLVARLIERWWVDLHPMADDGDHDLRIGALSWLLKQSLALARQPSRTTTRPLPTRADAQRALAALATLQRAVDARLGADGPSFAQAREALQDAVQGLPDEGTAASAGAAPAMPSAAGPATTLTVETPALAAAVGTLNTRAQALQQLRQVAEFFRRTEPHSPVAYLADKAARWGTMDLHLWLRQVVKDDATMSRLEDLLGVEPPRSND